MLCAPRKLLIFALPPPTPTPPPKIQFYKWPKLLKIINLDPRWQKFSIIIIFPELFLIGSRFETIIVIANWSGRRMIKDPGSSLVDN